MNYRSLSQIILVIIALVIVFTFIKPKFSELQAMEVELDKYTDAVDNAAEFNAELNRLMNKMNNIPNESAAALERYLPLTIRGAAIGRDLETVAVANNLFISALAIDTGSENQDSSTRAVNEEGFDANGEVILQQISVLDSLESHTFKISINGSYNNLINYLRDIEANAYPLTISELTIGSDEGSDETSSAAGFYTFNITFVTYSYNPAARPTADSLDTMVVEDPTMMDEDINNF